MTPNGSATNPVTPQLPDGMVMGREGVVAGSPIVRGRCPSCGFRSLFLGRGGYITCSYMRCGAPGAASDLLDTERCVECGVGTVARPHREAHLRAALENVVRWDSRLAAAHGHRGVREYAAWVLKETAD